MSAIPSTPTVTPRAVSETEARVLAEAAALKNSQRRAFILKSILANIVVIIFLIFTIFPIYFVVTAAFRPGQSLYSTTLQLFPTNASLDNFDYMMNHTPLFTWLRNSLFVAALTTIASVIICTTAAYAFSRWKFLGRENILTLMLAIQAFPGVLALIAIFVIFKELRLLDSLVGLVFAYTSGSLVFSIWNLKGYFDTIPADLEEAARVDGATATQAFYRVMLPLARPALAVTALLGFMAGWGDFIIAQTVLFSEDKYTIMVGLINLQNDYRQPWGWFAVGAIFAALPVMILFLFLQKQLQAGLTLGGVKG
jgi:arabinogalactan oligomer/maltooligosaccharide transport system permease protein